MIGFKNEEGVMFLNGTFIPNSDYASEMAEFYDNKTVMNNPELKEKYDRIINSTHPGECVTILIRMTTQQYLSLMRDYEGLIPFSREALFASVDGYIGYYQGRKYFRWGKFGPETEMY